MDAVDKEVEKLSKRQVLVQRTALTSIDALIASAQALLDTPHGTSFRIMYSGAPSWDDACRPTELQCGSEEARCRHHIGIFAVRHRFPRCLPMNNRTVAFDDILQGYVDDEDDDGHHGDDCHHGDDNYDKFGSLVILFVNEQQLTTL